jgi:DNA-directed RNA polymerase subunit beta'
VVITQEDCGTLRGIETSALRNNEEVIEKPCIDRLGRYSLHDILPSVQTDEPDRWCR